MKKNLKYSFYGLIIVALILAFVPLFKIDLRNKPTDDHIYVYRSFFVLGFPSYTLSVISSVFYYIPLLVLIVVTIPVLNKQPIVINALLFCAIVTSVVEIVWFNVDLTFLIAIILIIILTTIYNIQHFLKPTKA